MKTVDIVEIDRVLREVEPSLPEETREEVRKRLLEAERGVTREVFAWENDPEPPARPVRVPAPELGTPPLAIEIVGDAPDPALFEVGTQEFRYWSAAAALRRCADYWSRIVGDKIHWVSEIGETLPVMLDAGVDLNAFYDRRGLSFFHAKVHEKVIYSGESPDVLCHELGHAVLDALRPQLFDAGSDEIAAFHEAFGDISSLLSALQLPTFRQSVLDETDRDLRRSSRLSRLAEQLGGGIRQIRPDSVPLECLRNAVNSYFYQDPITLPPRGPVYILTSEPHSFSRVFTGAFYDAFAGMVAIRSSSPTEEDLLQVSEEAGRLLVKAILAAPIVPDYYSQVAAHMIAVDTDGQYREVLTQAFLSHGILSLEAANLLGSQIAAQPQLAAAAPRREASETLPRIALQGTSYGLRAKTLLVQAPSEPKRLPATAATPEPDVTVTPSGERAAKSFANDLFRRGLVDVGGHAESTSTMIGRITRRKTHRLQQTPEGLELKRILFE